MNGYDAMEERFERRIDALEADLDEARKNESPSSDRHLRDMVNVLTLQMTEARKEIEKLVSTSTWYLDAYNQEHSRTCEYARENDLLRAELDQQSSVLEMQYHENQRIRAELAKIKWQQEKL